MYVSEHLVKGLVLFPLVGHMEYFVHGARDAGAVMALHGVNANYAIPPFVIPKRFVAISCLVSLPEFKSEPFRKFFSRKLRKNSRRVLKYASVFFLTVWKGDSLYPFPYSVVARVS